ncbi:MAG: hypothetical protein ABI180_00840 [Microcoleus sp.]
MVADLQPPLDCKKIALLGLRPTYDYVLMDSSTMFFALTCDRQLINLEVCGGCFTKLMCYRCDRAFHC